MPLFPYHASSQLIGGAHLKPWAGLEGVQYVLFCPALMSDPPLCPQSTVTLPMSLEVAQLFSETQS